MNGELNPHDISRQFGLESVDHMLNQVEAYREHEARRIDLTNQATILSLKAEYSDATDRDLFQVGINRLASYLQGMVGLARADKRKRRLYT